MELCPCQNTLMQLMGLIGQFGIDRGAIDSLLKAIESPIPSLTPLGIHGVIE
jgi:hypothetical protein